MEQTENVQEKFMGLKLNAVKIDWKRAMDEAYNKFDELYAEQKRLTRLYGNIFMNPPLGVSVDKSALEKCEKTWRDNIEVGEIIQKIDESKKKDDVDGYLTILDSGHELLKPDKKAFYYENS